MVNGAIQPIVADLFGLRPAPLPTRRSRVTNQPTSRFSTATATGRRINDLFRGFIEQLPRQDCITQAQALAAAELLVAAEDARKELLNGKGDPEQLVRIENLASRAVRRLGLAPASEQKHVSLRERLATGVAEPAAAALPAPAPSLRERLADGAL